jgi:hypothetical protein
MERALKQTEMTSLYFSFQARLARLRQTGEIHPAEYGAGGPSEYLKVTSELQFHSPRNVSIRRLQNLLISKRLYASEGCHKKPLTDSEKRFAYTRGSQEEGSTLSSSRRAAHDQNLHHTHLKPASTAQGILILSLLA